MRESVDRNTIEKALWMQSAWQIDQREVDHLMGLVDQYVASAVPGAVTVACAHPWPPSFVDIPQEVRDRIAEERTRTVAEAFEEGKRAGRAEVAERPSERRTPLPEPPEAGRAYQAADGGVWLFLGPALPMGWEPQDGEDKPGWTRQCRKCGALKGLDGGFSKDNKARGGYRTVCKECDAERKRQYIAGKRNEEGKEVVR